MRSDERTEATPAPLAEILARAVTDGIYRFLLPGLAGPHRLVPLRSLADSLLSGNALAVAAKRGRLRAVRRTDQWYSTRQWVQEYKDEPIQAIRRGLIVRRLHVSFVWPPLRSFPSYP